MQSHATGVVPTHNEHQFELDNEMNTDHKDIENSRPLLDAFDLADVKRGINGTRMFDEAEHSLYKASVAAREREEQEEKKRVQQEEELKQQLTDRTKEAELQRAEAETQQQLAEANAKKAQESLRRARLFSAATLTVLAITAALGWMYYGQRTSLNLQTEEKIEGIQRLEVYDLIRKSTKARANNHPNESVDLAVQAMEGFENRFAKKLEAWATNEMTDEEQEREKSLHELEADCKQELIDATGNINGMIVHNYSSENHTAKVTADRYLFLAESEHAWVWDLSPEELSPITFTQNEAKAKEIGDLDLAPLPTPLDVNLWDYTWSSESRIEQIESSGIGQRDISVLAKNAKGDLLVTVDSKGEILFWDLKSEETQKLSKCLKRTKHNNLPINRLVISQNRIAWLTAGSGKVAVVEFDLASLRDQFEMIKKVAEIELDNQVSAISVALSNDGKGILVGGSDNRVRYWELGDRLDQPRTDRPKEFSGHDTPPMLLSFIEGTNQFVAASSDCVRRYSLAETKAQPVYYKNLSKPLLGVAAKAHRCVTVASESILNDKVVHVWDYKEDVRPPPFFFEGVEGDITHLALSDTGRWLVMVLDNRNVETIALWDLSSTSPASTLQILSSRKTKIEQEVAPSLPAVKKPIYESLLMQPPLLVRELDDGILRVILADSKTKIRVLDKTLADQQVTTKTIQSATQIFRSDYLIDGELSLSLAPVFSPNGKFVATPGSYLNPVEVTVDGHEKKIEYSGEDLNVSHLKLIAVDDDGRLFYFGSPREPAGSLAACFVKEKDAIPRKLKHFAYARMPKKCPDFVGFGWANDTCLIGYALTNHSNHSYEIYHMNDTVSHDDETPFESRDTESSVISGLGSAEIPTNRQVEYFSFSNDLTTALKKITNGKYSPRLEIDRSDKLFSSKFWHSGVLVDGQFSFDGDWILTIDESNGVTAWKMEAGHVGGFPPYSNPKTSRVGIQLTQTSKSIFAYGFRDFKDSLKRVD